MPSIIRVRLGDMPQEPLVPELCAVIVPNRL